MDVLETDLRTRAGALAVGAAHYMGSTKALAEEGIDPRIRLRAVPVAVRLFFPTSSPPARQCYIRHKIRIEAEHEMPFDGWYGMLMTSVMCPLRSFRR